MAIGLWAIFNNTIYVTEDPDDIADGHSFWFARVHLPVAGEAFDNVSRGIFMRVPPSLTWYQESGTEAEVFSNLPELLSKCGLPEDTPVFGSVPESDTSKRIAAIHDNLSKKVVAVDLDGTLAEYDHWRGKEHIGKPILAMVKRIKEWLENGDKVIIFTARATNPENIPYIKQWLEDNDLGALPITNSKTPDIDEFWDDRAIGVEENTGELKIKQGAIAIPIRTSLDYPHSWHKDRNTMNNDDNSEKNMHNKIATFAKATIQTSDIDDKVVKFIRDIQKDLPKAYLYEENDEKGWVSGGKQKLMHITILYGITNADYEPAKEIFKSFDKKITISTEEIDYFDQDDHTVAILRCKSDALRELHHQLKNELDITDTYPTYKPHITIAYLQPGTRLPETIEVPKIKWEIDTIDISNTNGELRMVHKTASVLDAPQLTLDPGIWDLSGDLPKLLPGVKKHLLEALFDYLTQYGGYMEPDKFIVGAYYTGSTATRRYVSSSDADIHLVVDWDMLAQTNPEKQNTVQAMWQELHNTFWYTLNGSFSIPGTKHPVTYFILPAGEEDKIFDTKEETYDMKRDLWIMSPNSEGLTLHETVELVKDEVEELMARIDKAVTELRNSLIDYFILRDERSNMIDADPYGNMDSIQERMADKLSEIHIKLDALRKDYILLKERRTKGFQDEAPVIGESKNWTQGNIIYKVFERYGYMDMLREIDRVLREVSERRQLFTEEYLNPIVVALTTKIDGWDERAADAGKHSALQTQGDLYLGTGGPGGQGGLGATPEDWAAGTIPGEGDGIPDRTLRRNNPKRYDKTRSWQGDDLDDSFQKTLRELKTNYDGDLIKMAEYFNPEQMKSKNIRYETDPETRDIWGYYPSGRIAYWESSDGDKTWYRDTDTGRSEYAENPAGDKTWYDDKGRAIRELDGRNGAETVTQYDDARGLRFTWDSRGEETVHSADGKLLYVKDITTGESNKYEYDATGKEITNIQGEEGSLYENPPDIKSPFTGEASVGGKLSVIAVTGEEAQNVRELAQNLFQRINNVIGTTAFNNVDAPLGIVVQDWLDNVVRDSLTIPQIQYILDLAEEAFQIPIYDYPWANTSPAGIHLSSKLSSIDPQILPILFEANQQGLNFEEAKAKVEQETGLTLYLREWEEAQRKHFSKLETDKRTVVSEQEDSVQHHNRVWNHDMPTSLIYRDIQEGASPEQTFIMADCPLEGSTLYLTPSEALKYKDIINGLPENIIKVGSEGGATDDQQNKDVPRSNNPYENFGINSILERGESASEGPLNPPGGHDGGSGGGSGYVGQPNREQLRQDPWGKQPTDMELKKHKPVQDQLFPDFNEAPGYGGGRPIESSISDEEIARLKKIAEETRKDRKAFNKYLDEIDDSFLYDK